MAKVLVTGASGFIAGYVIEELLAHGYEVRGSVRRSHPELERFEIEIVEADLLDPKPWAGAARGCDYVLHMASPLPVATSDEAELVGPAVDGTRNVLRGAAEAGAKRVVVTSSSASIVNVDRPPSHVYTEADWSDPDRCSAYPKSKILAERAAWASAGELGLELVVVNPTLVVGPVQIPRTNTSLEPIRRLLAGAMPAVPKLGFTIVDVRDVATGHRLALEQSVAAGQRYLLCTEFMWMRDVALLLAEAFPERKIPTRKLPYPLLWLASRFDPGLRTILPDVGVQLELSSAKARAELGWGTRDVRASVREAARSLVDAGLV